tara:strand:+ start:109052 stop:109306 length:255 start_codon:yes stop_codon:yes gene_type:complete
MSKKSKAEKQEETRVLAGKLTSNVIETWETVGASLTEAPIKYDPELDMVAVIYPNKINLFFNRDDSGFKEPYPCWFEESLEIPR